MSNLLTQYREAADRYVEARDKLSGMIGRIKSSLEYLDSGDSFVRLQTQERGALRADKWPDADTLTKMIQDAETSRRAAKAAYEAIPELDRALVTARH